MIINCKDSDWQNSLRSTLRQHEDVDLTNVNLEYDGEYLKQLAKDHGMFFANDEEMRAAFFRKEKFNFQTPIAVSSSSTRH